MSTRVSIERAQPDGIADQPEHEDGSDALQIEQVVGGLRDRAALAGSTGGRDQTGSADVPTLDGGADGVQHRGRKRRAVHFLDQRDVGLLEDGECGLIFVDRRMANVVQPLAMEREQESGRDGFGDIRVTLLEIAHQYRRGRTEPLANVLVLRVDRLLCVVVVDHDIDWRVRRNAVVDTGDRVVDERQPIEVVEVHVVEVM